MFEAVEKSTKKAGGAAICIAFRLENGYNGSHILTKEENPMSILDQLSSAPLYLITGLIILYVAGMSVFFLIRAWKAGVAIGMDKVKLRRAVTSSVTFSILPSVSILLGVIALSGTLGIPLPWLRLSVVVSSTMKPVWLTSPLAPLAFPA